MSISPAARRCRSSASSNDCPSFRALAAQAGMRPSIRFSITRCCCLVLSRSAAAAVGRGLTIIRSNTRARTPSGTRRRVSYPVSDSISCRRQARRGRRPGPRSAWASRRADTWRRRSRASRSTRRRAAVGTTASCWRRARATIPTSSTTARRRTPTAGRFRVSEAGAVDGAEDTDGLHVVSTPLGPRYLMGLLVVQDGINLAPDAAEANQNFKLVSWQDVLDALDLAPSEGQERE